MLDVRVLKNSGRRAAFCRDRIQTGRIAINNRFTVYTPIRSPKCPRQFRDHRRRSALRRYSHEIIAGNKSAGNVSNGLIIWRPECLVDTSRSRNEARLLLVEVAKPELAAIVF